MENQAEWLRAMSEMEPAKFKRLVQTKLKNLDNKNKQITLLKQLYELTPENSELSHFLMKLWVQAMIERMAGNEEETLRFLEKLLARAEKDNDRTMAAFIRAQAQSVELSYRRKQDTTPTGAMVDYITGTGGTALFVNMITIGYDQQYARFNLTSALSALRMVKTMLLASICANIQFAIVDASRPPRFTTEHIYDVLYPHVRTISLMPVSFGALIEDLFTHRYGTPKSVAISSTTSLLENIATRLDHRTHKVRIASKALRHRPPSSIQRGGAVTAEIRWWLMNESTTEKVQQWLIDPPPDVENVFGSDMMTTITTLAVYDTAVLYALDPDSAEFRNCVRVHAIPLALHCLASPTVVRAIAQCAWMHLGWDDWTDTEVNSYTAAIHRTLTSPVQGSGVENTDKLIVHRNNVLMYEAAPHIAMPEEVAEQKRHLVNYIRSGVEGVPFERLGLARTVLHPHINEFNAQIAPRTSTMGRVKKETKNKLEAEARPPSLDTGGITPAQIAAHMSVKSSARLRGMLPLVLSDSTLTVVFHGQTLGMLCAMLAASTLVLQWDDAFTMSTVKIGETTLLNTIPYVGPFSDHLFEVFKTLTKETFMLATVNSSMAEDDLSDTVTLTVQDFLVTMDELLTDEAAAFAATEHASGLLISGKATAKRTSMFLKDAFDVDFEEHPYKWYDELIGTDRITMNVAALKITPDEFDKMQSWTRYELLDAFDPRGIAADRLYVMLLMLVTTSELYRTQSILETVDDALETIDEDDAERERLTAVRERYAAFEHNLFEKYLVVLTINEHLLKRVGGGFEARFRSFKEAHVRRRRYDDVTRTLIALLERLASKSDSAAAFNAFVAAVDQERPRVWAQLDLRDARAARRR